MGCAVRRAGSQRSGAGSHPDCVGGDGRREGACSRAPGRTGSPAGTHGAEAATAGTETGDGAKTGATVECSRKSCGGGRCEAGSCGCCSAHACKERAGTGSMDHGSRFKEGSGKSCACAGTETGPQRPDRQPGGDPDLERTLKAVRRSPWRRAHLRWIFSLQAGRITAVTVMREFWNCIRPGNLIWRSPRSLDLVSEKSSW